MKRFISLLLLTALLCGILSGCGCEHQWESATCLQPEVCSLCGETRGSTISHNYGKATCSQPETCTLCGETRGQPLDHDFKYIECGEPEICYMCGETQGKPVEHQWENGACRLCSAPGPVETEPAETEPAQTQPTEPQEVHWHTPGKWKILLHATGEYAGMEELRCTDCSSVLAARVVAPKYPTENITCHVTSATLENGYYPGDLKVCFRLENHASYDISGYTTVEVNGYQFSGIGFCSCMSGSTSDESYAIVEGDRLAAAGITTIQSIKLILNNYATLPEGYEYESDGVYPSMEYQILAGHATVGLQMPEEAYCPTWGKDDKVLKTGDLDVTLLGTNYGKMYFALQNKSSKDYCVGIQNGDEAWFNYITVPPRSTIVYADTGLMEYGEDDSMHSSLKLYVRRLNEDGVLYAAGSMELQTSMAGDYYTVTTEKLDISQ